MLVLARRRGERILIGEEITIEVVRVNRDQVRLGIVAPRGTPIDREEIRRPKRVHTGWKP